MNVWAIKNVLNVLMKKHFNLLMKNVLKEKIDKIPRMLRKVLID